QHFARRHLTARQSKREPITFVKAPENLRPDKVGDTDPTLNPSVRLEDSMHSAGSRNIPTVFRCANTLEDPQLY
ncbi:hypothetical protein ACHAPE_000700, partial [Trichoderma viride]